jgi:cobalamin biosynthesis protein CobD/CbiB
MPTGFCRPANAPLYSTYKKATIVFYRTLWFTVILPEPGCGWPAAALAAALEVMLTCRS